MPACIVSRTATLLDVLAVLIESHILYEESQCLLFMTQSLRAVSSRLLVSVLPSCISVWSSSSKCSFIALSNCPYNHPITIRFFFGFSNTLMNYSLSWMVLGNLIRKVRKNRFDIRTPMISLCCHDNILKITALVPFSCKFLRYATWGGTIGIVHSPSRIASTNCLFLLTGLSS